MPETAAEVPTFAGSSILKPEMEERFIKRNALDAAEYLTFAGRRFRGSESEEKNGLLSSE